MTKLAKELSLYGLIMVAIGSSIGSGIFVTPSQIAGAVPSSGMILLVWALGGVVALTGALTFSEMGALFPKAGGVYVFLKEAYGGWCGFLFGWAYLVIIITSTIAAIALAFAHYLSFFIPMDDNWKVITGIIAIIILTILNVLRAKFGEVFSNIFTSLKILGILIIIVVGFTSGNAGLSFKSNAASVSYHVDVVNFSVALTGVLFSYGGWQHASFLAGEIQNPARNVPLAMIVGAIAVTILYLLVNIAYMLLLPVNTIITSGKVAAEAVSTVLPFGGMLVAGIIMISTLGTIGVYTLSSPRIYYAMASDGLFFKRILKVHPVFKTPLNAIIIQSGWSIILLIFCRTLENLITYIVSIESIFYALTAIGIFILRKKLKDAERPYKTNGYPVTPLIFICIYLWFIINIGINKPFHMAVGLAFLALGLPAYFYFRSHASGENINN